MSVYVGERDVLSVLGADAESYLQGQVSQDVSKLAIGESAWSLVLQPQGKVVAWFRVTRVADDGFLLDVDAGFGETLLARIKRFMMRVKVDLELATWTLHAYDEVIDAATLTAPIVSPSADGLGVDVIGPDLASPTAPELSADDHLRRRIESGIPAMGTELGESTIPAEAGIVNRSVSFTKGCYTGQELVARVDSRGDNTPRRLRIVSGAGAGTAAVGDELHNDGSVAGTITSVAATSDGWVALAYVKRSSFDASELDFDGNSVAVRRVPGDAA